MVKTNQAVKTRENTRGSRLAILFLGIIISVAVFLAIKAQVVAGTIKALPTW